MNILIQDCIIVPMDRNVGKKYFTGCVGIQNNTIELVTSASSTSDEVMGFINHCGDEIELIDGKGKLVMPGLINLHNHVSMSLMRGYADDLPLMTWLNDYVWPFEEKLTGDDISLGAELGIAEMLLGGTTTFVDMYWDQDKVAEAVNKTGIRAVLSPTFTDIRFDDFEKDFSTVLEKYGRGQNPRITMMIAPHSVYTCSREHLLRAKDLSEKYGIGLNIHVSETLDEQEVMQNRIGKTPIEYLDELGMLTPSSLVVHAVYVSERDIVIMRNRGVSVAHNPHSNMKLASGISPVVRMLDAGINVGIGTDGACSNNDLDMWEELRTASFLQKVSSMNPLILPAYEALEMATVNGARALGMEDKLGMLKPGMLADIIILDIEKAHLYPQHDMIANLAYCAKSSDVESVIIDGNIVVRNGKNLRLDTTEICHQAQKRTADILKR